MEQNDHIKSSNYSFVEENEMSLLLEYADHRRLGVFHHKGTKCANPECNRIGTRLIYGRDNGGSIHLDVYTDDLVLMTVDHVIPRSLGGSDHLDNKEPMCFPCNNRKGNSFIGTDKFGTIGGSKSNHKKNGKNIKYGRVWRKCIRKHTDMSYVGVGDLLIDSPLPTMLTLLTHRHNHRIANRKKAIG